MDLEGEDGDGVRRGSGGGGFPAGDEGAEGDGGDEEEGPGGEAGAG
jgi:hypothetical protein